MRNEYLIDRRWSDKYTPLIMQTIGAYLLAPASEEVDMTQAADLVTLKARGLTIACRVRRPGFVAQYGWEFTMRSERLNGTKTEMQKIVEGWGDWMFYAHAQEGNDLGFSRWLLIDLAAWRVHFVRDAYLPERQLRCGHNVLNADGATCFSWFDVRSFPSHPPLLIAASEPVPNLTHQAKLAAA